MGKSTSYVTLDLLLGFSTYLIVHGTSRIVFGIYTIGSLTGAIPAAYLPDKFGRRFSMFIGNLFIIVGAIVTANAKNRAMFIGGRFLTGKCLLLRLGIRSSKNVRYRFL